MERYQPMRSQALEQMIELLTEAVPLVADVPHHAGDGHLLTAAAWLRRARRTFRDCQDLIELEILEQDEERGKGRGRREDIS